MIRDIPAFAALKDRMHYLQARQRVLATNVANADTPGFKPQDVSPGGMDPTALGRNGPRPATPRIGTLGLAVTDRGHLGGREGGAPGLEGRGAVYETRPSRNAVSLEDEMMKVSQNQGAFQTAATLYQRGLQTLKLALGRRA